MTYRILRRPWKRKAPLYWGLIPELAGVVPALILFGVQHPDAFRSLFWRIGFENKLNSNPNMILYAYANYQPLPKIPFVWSYTLIKYNVAISIVSLFVLIARMIAIIMKVYFPIIGVFFGLGQTALYAVSVYGQAGPDYADERYPSPSPWYLRIGCSVAEPYNAVKSCRMAQGTFAVTVYLLTLYFLHSCFAIWSMLPNKDLDKPAADSDDEEDSPVKKDKAPEVELQQVPFTPRTQAFHALERKLPLRAS